jgi:hypothetical protein
VSAMVKRVTENDDDHDDDDDRTTLRALPTRIWKNASDVDAVVHCSKNRNSRAIVAIIVRAFCSSTRMGNVGNRNSR